MLPEWILANGKLCDTCSLRSRASRLQSDNQHPTISIYTVINDNAVIIDGYDVSRCNKLSTHHHRIVDGAEHILQCSFCSKPRGGRHRNDHR
jgi:hypothetical protein